ncbi:MAG TPA: hypothetical protein VIJ34_12145 [Acidimicrobiales bacterium]
MDGFDERRYRLEALARIGKSAVGGIIRSPCESETGVEVRSPYLERQLIRSAGQGEQAFAVVRKKRVYVDEVSDTIREVLDSAGYHIPP